MKTWLTFLLVLAVALGTPGSQAFAKGKKKHHDSGINGTLLEVSAVSVTLGVGKDGTVHRIFKITDQTKVSIDGQSANARDLLAGMTAEIEADDDAATSVKASDPKKKKHKK